MGPLSVGTAGLMWGHVAVAGPGPGGGLGALRLPPGGDCGARPAAAARCACCRGGLRGRDGSRGAVAPAAWGDFGVGVNRGLILSREVNELIWTPEALAYFDRYFLRFYRVNPAVFLG